MSLKSLDAIAWTKQDNALGLSFNSSVYSFEATSTGGVSTIVSSTLTAYGSADDDFVGCLVEVIRCANGPTGEKGGPLRRRVVGYDYSGDQLYIEALPFSTADGDSFTLLDPPNPYWAEDTGGSSTLVQDATRGEADDYWLGNAEKGGPYMQCIRATNVLTSLNTLVTDFSTATGNATVATLAESTVVGDLFECWEWPEVFSGAPLTWNQPRVDRNFISGQHGRTRGFAGLREGSGTIELAFRGPGRSRIGDAAECDTPFGSIMDVTAAPSDLTVSTGSSLSFVTCAAGTPSIGDMYCTENGDVFMTAAAGANATPSPNIRVAPANGTTAYGLRRYTPADAVNYAMAVKQWWGKEQVDTLYGCVPNIQIGGARGEYAKITMPMQVADGYRVYLDESNAAYSRPINPKTSTITPRVLGDCRCSIDNVEYEMRNFNIDLGLDIQQHTNLAAPNSTDGFALVSDNVTGTVDIWMETDARLTTQKWLMGKPMTLLIQAGEHPGEPGVLAFWAYEVEVTACEGAEDAGFHTVSVQWRVTLDTTMSTSLYRWAIGVG